MSDAHRVFSSQYQYKQHLHHDTSMSGWLCLLSQFKFGMDPGMYLSTDPSHDIFGFNAHLVWFSQFIARHYTNRHCTL